MKRINKYIIEKLKKINSKTEYVDSKELDLLNVAHSLYQFLDNTEVKSKYVNKDGFTILKNLNNNIVDTLNFITRYNGDFITKLSNTYKITYNEMKCYLRDNNDKLVDKMIYIRLPF
jgi:phage regulator Rha-like protein